MGRRLSTHQQHDQKFTKMKMAISNMRKEEGLHTAGMEWCFSWKNPFQDMFCDIQRVFPWKYKKCLCFKKVFLWENPLEVNNVSWNGFFWQQWQELIAIIELLPEGFSVHKLHIRTLEKNAGTSMDKGWEEREEREYADVMELLIWTKILPYHCQTMFPAAILI